MTKTVSTIIFALFLVFFLFSLFFVGLFSKYPILFKSQIKSASTKFQIDSCLIASIINTESGFDSNAKSNKGALGLMQILPSTANWICKKYNIEYQNENTLFDPQKNILIGCQYLQYLMQKFDNTDTALCAYNAGEGTVKNWLLDTNYSDDNTTLKKIPFSETENYLKKIKDNLKIYKFLY